LSSPRTGRREPGRAWRLSVFFCKLLTLNHSLRRATLRPCLALLGAFALTSASARADGPRATLNFNPGWRLHVGDAAGAPAPGFDDSAWKAVTLPHAWNEDDAFRKPIHEHPTGIAWYRKQFRLPAHAAGRKVFLELEGARQAADVYLNGRPVGAHENGVMAFGLDITDAVKPPPEVNVLAVRTDNDWGYRERLSGQRFQWADRNFNANYGGLPKNVRLHVTDRVYQTLPLISHLGTTGVYVYATQLDIAGRSARIHAESEVRNEADQPRTFLYRVGLRDLEGRTVATFHGGPYTVRPRERVTASASARVEGLHFWSWGYGYLYTVTTTLEADGQPFDAVATRTGFRKVELGQGVVKLNDRVIQLKGYAQRTSNEWPAVGLSVPPWLSDFSNRLMVEGNANLVRWMHVTPWRQDVESCDRVGLLQMMPAGDAEHDAQGRAWAQRLELMRDAIVYNRNSPSILVYEAGNKGVSEEHMVEMKALRDRYDPHGGRGAGAREMLDSQVAEYGGEMLYVNKSAGPPLWATEYSRDEGLRKYWDEHSPPFHKDGDGPRYRGASAAVYNRNQDTHAIENVVRWHDYWRERPGTGRRVSAGGVNIVFSDTNTHYRGAENYRRSGEVDAMRIPKDGFFAHQVMWDGWVDVERPRLHVLGHWSYRPGVKKDVSVVSSTDSVELFRNGRSLGRGAQSSRFLFTFRDVEWQAGTLTAVGLDARGAKVAEASLRTAGPPVGLKLTAHTGPAGLRADGADMALVQVEVVDARGQRCPTALDMVSFEVSGPAEWRGGIAQGPDNFILARALPVEGGVNRVLLRSRPEPGPMVVTARAEGLRPASLELRSVPFDASDGWSAVLPGDGLPSHLGRGPTPVGPSFTPTRRSVAITAVRAGSNPEAAARAFDDNEVTSWTSGGGLDGAWIEFTLERPADLRSASFKLTGWRERSYPIRILVDGEESYRGVTARSLGYVTIPLQARGERVRVELVDGASAADGFAITELADPANASTGAAAVLANTLSIVEAEFHEPAPEARDHH
jgi:beta-galactosidase